jgi:hypothetical protein
MRLYRLHLSAYFRGRKPISEKFLKKFYDEFFPALQEDTQMIVSEGGHSYGYGKKERSSYQLNSGAHNPVEEVKRVKEESRRQLEMLDNIEANTLKLLSAINSLTERLQATEKKINSLIAGDQEEAAKKNEVQPPRKIKKTVKVSIKKHQATKKTEKKTNRVERKKEMK